ncbi:MAG: AAA family ATPase [Candidatus Omnitrophota bacterium]|jgi:chromosome partitioning protein|nr:AAA family ATPase [Candidatus Omnitrophota bacterium]
MKIVAIANQKGGCGKTTTAINLSSAIARLGKKVLLIDLDPQAHATFGLGLSNAPVDKSIYNVLTDNNERRRDIAHCIVNISENLDMIPSNILLSTLEQELKDTEGAVSKLFESICAGRLNYEYTIIDCPPSLGFLTFNALRAANIVIVTVDMGAFSLMGVGKLLGMIELIKVKINHAPQVRALATLYDRRLKYSETMLKEIKTFFKDQLLETIIRLNVTLKKSVAQGISVLQLDSKSNGAHDHMALAQEVIRMEGAEEFKQALAEVSFKQEEAVLPVAPRIPAIQPAAEPVERGTVFSINAPRAKEIYIVGDFNHWKMDESSRLAKLDNGVWQKKFNLASGKYRYKFVVDGEWLLDSQNAEKEQNPFGTYDSVKKL